MKQAVYKSIDLLDKITRAKQRINKYCRSTTLHICTHTQFLALFYDAEHINEDCI